MNIGNRVYVSELLNDNYEFLHPDNTVVCQVRRARAALVLETEEGDDEDKPEANAEDRSNKYKDNGTELQTQNPGAINSENKA